MSNKSKVWGVQNMLTGDQVQGLPVRDIYLLGQSHAPPENNMKALSLLFYFVWMDFSYSDSVVSKRMCSLPTPPQTYQHPHPWNS